MGMNKRLDRLETAARTGQGDLPEPLSTLIEGMSLDELEAIRDTLATGDRAAMAAMIDRLAVRDPRWRSAIDLG